MRQWRCLRGRSESPAAARLPPASGARIVSAQLAASIGVPRLATVTRMSVMSALGHDPPTGAQRDGQWMSALPQKQPGDRVAAPEGCRKDACEHSRRNWATLSLAAWRFLLEPKR